MLYSPSVQHGKPALSCRTIYTTQPEFRSDDILNKLFVVYITCLALELSTFLKVISQILLKVKSYLENEVTSNNVYDLDFYAYELLHIGRPASWF